MNQLATLNTVPAGGVGRLVWVAALVSAAVLGFEISLMRILLVASWHHFVFLVISIALLGFGASGTALSMVQTWVLDRCRKVLFILALASAVSIPICSILAQYVPIEARFVPVLFWGQLGVWLCYWAILFVPFLLGASATCLALMMARDRVATVYGGSLVGSACGAILATILMGQMPPEWLPASMGVVALMGAVGVRVRSASWRLAVITVVILATGIGLYVVPPNIRVDPYKYLAYVHRLEKQQVAERRAVAYSPRAMVEVYRSDVFHDMPFLSVGVSPPPMDVVVLDGHYAGSMLRITDAEQAEVVDRTLMAFAYTLTPPRPRVLLLGEVGGGNVWLAVRHEAAAIDVVQPNKPLMDILRDRGATEGGNVFELPNVQVVIAEPRHFVQHTTDQYDLIQLVTLQSLSAGVGGMAGLGQDHLVTIEGILASLQCLAPEGVLSVCRGIQTPPRDNLKLLATFIEALRRWGVEQPEKHVVIVRDYLAVCTIVKATPWQPEQIEVIRQACTEQNLTPVWFSGIKPEELNQPDVLPNPPGEVGDWYYHAACNLFGPEAQSFINDWAFDIRPATDDRPFFLDFCKLRSISAFKKAFGELWLTRTELAFLFVLAIIGIVFVTGALLTVFPLVFLRDIRCSAGRLATAAYFAAIGMAYLLLEMTMLSKLTHLIGDPVQAAAVTISAFLFMSGIGSMVAQWMPKHRTSLFHWLLVSLVLVGIAELVALSHLTEWVGSLAIVWRSVISVLAIAPLAFLMGFPMPVGLARLDRGAPALIPWAWGINGFASVLAAPLATAIGMTWGFSLAGGMALLLYLAVLGLCKRLPERA